MRMDIRTSKDLHLDPVVDHRQMKVINAEYNVKVGYWALRNNIQEYKVYAIMIRMFNLDFVNIFYVYGGVKTLYV
jgi:hypothetical protein